MKPLKKHIISKSTFIRGQQCHKSLYLNKNHKELKDVITEQQRAIFKRGNIVGEMAQKIYPNGLDCTPDKFYNIIPSVLKTQDAINNGVEVIYEAAFQFDGVLALLDILVKKEGKWYAYEVKSAASVKGVYIQDASLQYYVINNSGIELEDISIIHLNSKYVRKNGLNLQELFKSKSILEAVKESQQVIKSQLLEQKIVLASKRVPKVEIGAHCNTPYPCDFKGYCWKEVSKHSVLNLNKGDEKVWDLFDSGIKNIKDIPTGTKLNQSQEIQVNSVQKGEDFIDKKEIKSFLEKLNYPIYFLDFETVMPAVPLFENTRTYQQLTFQYSLHITEALNSETTHNEYLAEGENIDPREGLIIKLIEDLKEEGTILVYNKDFEDRCLFELGRDFPQYLEPINKIRKRLVDLATPFEKRHYYTAEMKGKYSIKNVLPALVPELSYNDLEVQDGATASFTFLDMMAGTFEGDISETRKNLLDYCKLDTFAMVKILEKLYKVLD